MPRHRSNNYLRLALGLGLALVLHAPLAPAQDDEGDEEGREKFAQVDPYTEGQPEAMQALGYRSFGPFLFLGNDRTDFVQREMGGSQMLFVETEHFKLGSSLTSYAYSDDREEKKKLAAEVKALGELLGSKLKAPRKKIDGWLRLHLFARRLEASYQRFHELFGIEPADYEAQGTYLGQPNKFVVVLCQRSSEFGRFERHYLQVETPVSYRWYLEGGGMGVVLDVEGLAQQMWADDETPLDTVLHCFAIQALAGNFANAYRRNNGAGPYWLEAALGHFVVREVDPRWVASFGLREGGTIDDDDHEWSQRVLNLVGNDFYASLEDMFAWREYAELNHRDHMVAWSKLEFLLTELQGDRRGFLNAVSAAAPVGDEAQARAAAIERQVVALEDCFELTPAEFDEAWASWVERTYKKR
ncbi:hypothetical protein [Engelhardtia mirabilis]